MRPSDYRKKGYTRSIRQNNFYNGPLLAMAFMNNIAPPDEYDIWEAQKNAIRTHSLSMRYQKLLRGLNADIFSNAVSGFNPAIEAAITNHIADKIKEIRTNYYPTIKELRVEQAQSSNIAYLQTQAKLLFAEYSALLTFINNAIQSGKLGVPGAPIIQQLNAINVKINEAYSKLNQYMGSPVLGGEISNYFYAINTLFSAAMGFSLEDEVTTALTGWLPTNMQIENTGAIQVTSTIVLNGSIQNSSRQAGVDNMVFDKSLIDKIKIKWEQAPIGKSTQKQTHIGTLKEFLEAMKQSRQDSFYLSESMYARLCRAAIATIQSKAMGVGAKNMIMKRDVQLFEPMRYQGISAEVLNINTAFRKYMTNELNAVLWMKRLYELSAQENAPKSSNYIQRHEHYQAFINYSLSKMVPYILENNEFLLSNKYGLISFFDFFEQSHHRIFTWGTNKTASLAGGRSNLATAKYHILLRE